MSIVQSFALRMRSAWQTHFTQSASRFSFQLIGICKSPGNAEFSIPSNQSCATLLTTCGLFGRCISFRQSLEPIIFNKFSYEVLSFPSSQTEWLLRRLASSQSFSLADALHTYRLMHNAHNVRTFSFREDSSLQI